MHCEVCAFRNPKATVAGVFIQNNAILLLKRNEGPFQGQWDFPSGYVNEGETSDIAVVREMKEELGIDVHPLLIKEFPGFGFWKEFSFPTLTHVYLCDFGEQEIKLNQENSDFKWVPLKDLGPNEIHWEFNENLCDWLKQKFTLDLEGISQGNTIDEQSLYKKILNH